MSFDKVTCFIPSCDGVGCGEDWWQHETTEADGPPHYMSKPEAIKLLRECWGWNITRNIDGSFTMLCAHCVQLTRCAAGHHTWFTPELDVNAPIADLLVEICKCCRITRRDQPLRKPPAGHPESMARLDPIDEALIHALETELTQEI